MLDPFLPTGHYPGHPSGRPFTFSDVESFSSDTCQSASSDLHSTSEDTTTATSALYGHTLAIDWSNAA